jgi:Zn-dependent protease with chaperone function
MDFFESQDRARRRTGLLIGYFAAAVVLIVATLYLVIVFALGLTGYAGDGHRLWWQPGILGMVAGLTLSIVGLGSAYKTWELRGGGEGVAAKLGGRRIPPNSTDLAERRLLNVVEEMALASGIPVPPVFLLDRERSINAFAAGFTPGDAVLGVTRGMLDTLNRDELQGVIGHEFSHILNGDMRLNLRLIGLLHGILLIAIVGYYLLRIGGESSGRRSSRDEKGGGVPLWVIGLAAMVIGYIGVFFARLIKAAISRQREYLADAAAVQFTRNPLGLADALKKIGGLPAGSRLETPEAEIASHMFFGSGFREQWLHALDTHPPLVDRIRRLEPRFNGRFPAVRSVVAREEEAARRTEAVGAGGGGQPAGFGVGRLPGGMGAFEKIPLDPMVVMAAVGTPVTEHVAYAARLIASLPPTLADALHDPFSARAAVFALLLDRDPAIRERQLQLLRDGEGSPTAEETLKLAPLVEEQGAPARLPMIEIAQSTLRGLAPAQYDRFRVSVDRLVKADETINLLEFTLQRVLLVHLDRHFYRQKPPLIQYYALGGVMPETTCLLSALAHAGAPTERPDAQEVHRAFERGIAVLGTPDRRLALLPRGDCTLESVSGALDKLAQSAPAIKRRALHAAVTVVAADGQVTVAEAELLRAIAESLDCPLPPMAAG